MISIRLQIEQLERARFYAFKTDQASEVKRLNAMLAPLYMQQQLECWAKVAKSNLRRKGLPAYRVFVTEMN